MTKRRKKTKKAIVLSMNGSLYVLSPDGGEVKTDNAEDFATAIDALREDGAWLHRKFQFAWGNYIKIAKKRPISYQVFSETLNSSGEMNVWLIDLAM